MLRLAVLIAAAAGCGAMRTRETVQRTVLLRTTGSDPQPAASGYIYQKDDDGPERFVHMGASEVLEQLSQLYTRPAPAAAERVVPVRERQADGVADEDYARMFEHFGAGRGYDRYLQSLERLEAGLLRERGAAGAGDDRGSRDHYGRYGEADGGGYRDAEFASYSTSGGHGAARAELDRGNDDDARDSRDHRDDRDDHEHFRKSFADEYKHYGAGDAARAYRSDDPKHYGAAVAGEGQASTEEQAHPSFEEPAASDETRGDGGQTGQGGGRGYDYVVKH